MVDWQLALVLLWAFLAFSFALWDLIVYPFVLWDEDDE